MFWFISHGFQLLSLKYHFYSDFYHCSTDSVWKTDRNKQLQFLGSCCPVVCQGRENHLTKQAKDIPNIDQARWKQINNASLCSVLWFSIDGKLQPQY